MKVRELIEKLQQLDPEMDVRTYEGGEQPADIRDVRIVSMVSAMQRAPFVIIEDDR